MVGTASKNRGARSMTGDTGDALIRWLVSIEVNCERYNGAWCSPATSSLRVKLEATTRLRS